MNFLFHDVAFVSLNAKGREFSPFSRQSASVFWLIPAVFDSYLELKLKVFYDQDLIKH
jgi:hypothetical protein